MSFDYLTRNIAQCGGTIINSVGVDTTDYGGICRSIVEAADSTFLTNAIQEKNGKVKVGDIFITQAYGLPAKNIVHLVTPHFKNDPDMTVLENCLRSVLLKCRESGFRDIYVPIIGTGGNKYPSDLAKEMISRMCCAFAKYDPKMNVTVVLAPLQISKNNDARLARERHTQNELSQFTSDIQEYIKHNNLVKPSSKEQFDYDNDYFEKGGIKKKIVVKEEDYIPMSYSDQFEVDSVKSYIDFYIRTRYHLCNVPKTNECLARVRHYLSINANGSNIKSGTQALSRYKNRTTVPTRENAFKIVLALKMTYEEAVQFLKFCGYRLVEDSLLLKSDIVISEAIKKRIYDNNVIDKMLVDNGSDPLFAR